MSEKLVQVAIAILYHQDQFLLQLRDNIPTIPHPGCWGLFGGHIEPDETPEIAVKRELWEEISYASPNPSLFGYYPDSQVMRHVFHAPLTVNLDQLVLAEGWDMALLTPEEIRRGEHYSEKAEQFRPIGLLHQKILLDFIDGKEE